MTTADTKPKKCNKLLYINVDLPATNPDGNSSHVDAVWEQQSAKKQRSLVVANKLAKVLPANTPVKCLLGWLTKGNHAFVYLNQPDESEPDKTNGLFLSDKFDYVVVNNDNKHNYTIFERGSLMNGTSAEDLEDFQGYKRFGLYKLGAKIKVDTDEDTDTIYELTLTGWNKLSGS